MAVKRQRRRSGERLEGIGVVSGVALAELVIEVARQREALVALAEAVDCVAGKVAEVTVSAPSSRTGLRLLHVRAFLASIRRNLTRPSQREKRVRRATK